MPRAHKGSIIEGKSKGKEKMGYDKKFRERVLWHIDAGEPYEKVRAMFKLGENTIRDWQKLRSETGSLENRPLERRWRKIGAEKLRADVSEHPDSFDEERAGRLGASRSGVQEARRRLKITRKKDSKLH